jgi:hypothetical protein
VHQKLGPRVEGGDSLLPLGRVLLPGLRDNLVNMATLPLGEELKGKRLAKLDIQDSLDG